MYSYEVSLTDVPNEISLAFAIAGCNLACRGCFWQELAKQDTTELDDILFQKILKRYTGLASCVLFYGGEWGEDALIAKLQYAHAMGFKTCLYTGRTRIKPSILDNLDYLKTGRYDVTKGGLTSATTNQRFYDVVNQRDLTPLFRTILPTTSKPIHDTTEI